MKIQSLTTGSIGYSRKVRDKSDGQSPGQQSPEQNSDQSNQDHAKEQETQDEITLEKLEQAVEAFQCDHQTHTNGLSASVSGAGPGLKVILKDVSGGVVRQLTGEEFLRLGETASREGKIRGKILDQKL